MRKNMFFGASNLTFENAKALRKNLTPSELVLWGYLKQKPQGYKFRRQHPLGRYIADFYCHSLRLIIEVDGDIHSDEAVASNDAIRQQALENEGLTIIRFKNETIEKQLEIAITEIDNYIKQYTGTT